MEKPEICDIKKTQIFFFSILQEVGLGLANQGHRYQEPRFFFLLHHLLCLLFISKMVQNDCWSAAVHHVCVQVQKKWFTMVNTLGKLASFKEICQNPHPVTFTYASLVMTSCRETRKCTLSSGCITSLNKIRFCR